MEQIKKVKGLPTFWTFLKRNGVYTIHQARFTKLVVTAKNDRVNFRCIEVNEAFLRLAGKDNLFVGRTSKSKAGCENINLNDIFDTKEAVEAYIETGKHTFPRVFTEDKYIPADESSLYDCDQSWFNNLPPNTFTDEGKDCNELYLCTYVWDGLKPVVKGVVGNSDYHTMQFDMVSMEWVTKPTHQCYGSKEECLKANKIEVYVFDD